MLGNFGVHSGGVFLVQYFTPRGYAPIYAQNARVCGTGKIIIWCVPIELGAQIWLLFLSFFFKKKFGGGGQFCDVVVKWRSSIGDLATS